MRRLTVMAALVVLGTSTFGCVVGGAPEVGPDAAVATLEPAADDRLDALEAELAEVRGRVDDLEARTAGPGTQPGEDSTEPGEDSAGPAEPGAARPAPLRAPEALIDQPRVYLRDLDDLPEGSEPGVTDWTAFEVPDEVQGVYGTPGEVVAQLAAVEDAPRLGTEVWETTIRVLLDDDDPDLAYGAMLSWGLLDDSIEGRDVRITLTRTDDDRWQPGGAEQRFHCIRGVTDDGELCV